MTEISSPAHTPADFFITTPFLSSLLFCKGYGWADKEAGAEMSPACIMRVASVSKLLTATAIMKLQEAGRLHLKDTVFGP